MVVCARPKSEVSCAMCSDTMHKDRKTASWSPGKVNCLTKSNLMQENGHSSDSHDDSPIVLYRSIFTTAPPPPQPIPSPIVSATQHHTHCELPKGSTHKSNVTFTSHGGFQEPGREPAMGGCLPQPSLITEVVQSCGEKGRGGFRNLGAWSGLLSGHLKG